MGLGQVAGAAVRTGLGVVTLVAFAAFAPSLAAASDNAHAARIAYFEPLRVLPASSSAQQINNRCEAVLPFVEAFN